MAHMNLAQMILSPASRIFVAAAVLASGAAANAAVTIGALTGGTAQSNGGVFQLIQAPAAVGNNNQQSNNLIAFNERQRVTLPFTLFPLIGDPIPLGTKVSSHGIVFDPVVSRTGTGWVEFDAPVLGLMIQRAGISTSNSVLSAPGTFYNLPAGIGLEGTDFIEIDPANPFRVNLRLTSGSPGDFARVITAIVPEPTTWAMLVAGFGFVGVGLRSRSRPGAGRNVLA